MKKVKAFLYLLYFSGVTHLYANNIGDTIVCEASNLTGEYVRCEQNKVFKVLDLLKDGWLSNGTHAFYITFKKVRASQHAMRCLESAMFPGDLGACKGDLFSGPKTWPKRDAEKDGWIFELAIDDTVYYVKE